MGEIDNPKGTLLEIRHLVMLLESFLTHHVISS